MEILTLTYRNFRHPPISKLIRRMNNSRVVAMRSPDPRLKVGCTIVNHKWEITSYDCNRKPFTSKNFKDCLTVEGRSKPDLLHAEIAAVLNLRSFNSGSKAFVTSAPCERCVGVLAERGINEIYFRHDHDDNAGIKLFEEEYKGKATKLVYDEESVIKANIDGYNLLGYLFDISKYRETTTCVKPST